MHFCRHILVTLVEKQYCEQICRTNYYSTHLFQLIPFFHDLVASRDAFKSICLSLAVSLAKQSHHYILSA